MSKFKNWLKENWLYVAGGVATAGVIAAAVIKGLKPSDSNSNLLTIDASKNDWMDLKELKTHWSFKDKGNELTVRQALCCGMADSYVCDEMVDRGLLTDELKLEIGTKFVQEHEDIASVLNTIEGYWEEPKSEE